jgi:hypothetical protein
MFLSESDIARRLGVCPEAVRKHRRRGNGPAPIATISDWKMPIYPPDALAGWRKFFATIAIGRPPEKSKQEPRGAGPP